MPEIEELRAKIKSTGYWDITIRPTEFDRARVGTLGDCWDLVASSSVSWRGWDYPHVEIRGRELGDSWVQGSVDWDSYGHLEIWRLWQSGQFKHLFACGEDYHKITHRAPAPGGPYLLWVSAMLTLTEIFEFARRLAAKEILGGDVLIQVALHNMANRALTYWSFDDHLGREYLGTLNSITYEVTVSPEALMSSSSHLAVDAAIHVYERFGWLNPPRRLIEDKQKVLLDRRQG
jgi:hypothetical protein